MLVDGIIIGIFFMLLDGFILPLSKRFLAIQHDIIVAERRVQDFQALVAPGLQKNVDEIEALRGSFFVYSSDKSLEFIELLEGAAKRNSLTYNIGEFQSGAPPSGMQVKGNFFNVIKFLREFENGTTLFQITGLTLTSAGLDSVSADVRFSLASL